MYGAKKNLVTATVVVGFKLVAESKCPGKNRDQSSFAETAGGGENEAPGRYNL